MSYTARPIGLISNCSASRQCDDGLNRDLDNVLCVSLCGKKWYIGRNYCIVQNGGGVKLWQIGNFQNLAGKTLVNCNKLSLSSSIKTCHQLATLNLKPQAFIFMIIMCGIKIACVFASSSVVRG